MGDDWESALRKLTRETPTAKIKTLVLDTMHSDIPDRPAALVMAAAADTMVQSALVYALALKEPKQVLDLFYGDGPFSTFDKKIVAAASLKVVGARTVANLKVIKNVRNVFAHALTDVSFGSGPIERACARIKLSKKSELLLELVTGRKTRFIFGHACNEIFQGVLSYCGTKWLTGDMGKRSLLDHPILP
ncbi:MAG: hypothetical protein KGO48_13575 [Alphaproteobacteria bacterium]|nr:hypothetical protein [Alphaproteobacteria bacterium]